MNLVKEEEKEWFDSAKARKNISFSLLVRSNDWKKILRVLEKNKDDDDFYEYAVDEMEKELTAKCKSGKADSALVILDQQKNKLESLIDTAFTSRIITAAEDQLFTGVWYGEKSLKSQEIEFKRQGKSLNGISHKSLNGWTENSIIYKDLSYQQNMLWKMNPKIFSYSYYRDNTSTYYAKKGTLTFISKDTLLLDYESLGSSNRFHRDK